MEAEIISNLITVAPVVAVLLYFLIYFRGELRKKDKRIESLQDELRASDKENITVMNALNVTLNELVIVIKTKLNV